MINPSYTSPRNDVLKLVPFSVNRVLDVGCSTGELGLAIKKKCGAFVAGIELDLLAAKEAEKKLDKVYVANIEHFDFQILSGEFQAIIFADILEHTKDPWAVLENAKLVLSQDGIIIISIPNVQHITVFKNLVLGLWPINDRGIFDKTHLRYFTYKSILSLADCSSMKIQSVNRQFRFFDRPHFVNKFAKLFSLPLIRNFFTYQYIVKLKRYE